MYSLGKKITCMFSKIVTVDILSVFIESVVFHHVGLSCLIETKDQYDFTIDKTFPHWCEVGPWYNTTTY